MKLIILQGLPGCGKSTIAKKLIKKLFNSKHIEVDKFKIKALNKNKTWEESQEISYKKTMDLINKFKLKKINYIIIDELFANDRFMEIFNNYIRINGLTYYWFKIDRPVIELLKIEKQRKRKIKNSLKDFSDLQKTINKREIKNQFNINNYTTANIDELVDQIIRKLS